MSTVLPVSYNDAQQQQQARYEAEHRQNQTNFGTFNNNDNDNNATTITINDNDNPPVTVDNAHHPAPIDHGMVNNNNINQAQQQPSNNITKDYKTNPYHQLPPSFCADPLNFLKFLFITNKNATNYFHPKTLPNTTIPHRIRYGWKSILIYYLLEYLIALIFLAFILAVLFSGVSASLSPYFRIDDPALSYPNDTPEWVPFWLVASVFVVAIPLGSFVIFQLLFVRNLVDFHHAILGYLQCLAFTMAIVAFGWLTYPAYRPNFLAECNPDMNKVNQIIENVKRTQFYTGVVYFQPQDICQDPERFTLANPSQSPAFPSGHVASAVSVWLFMLFYFAAKANTWRKREGQFCKVMLFFILFLIPVFIGISRILNLRHNVAQTIVGILIGIFAAVITYKYKFCSIFGRDAHVPNYYLWRLITKEDNYDGKGINKNSKIRRIEDEDKMDRRGIKYFYNFFY